MRFIHTADWQIGMKAAGLGEAGAAVRQARLEAAEEVVKIDADFLLVAGDTFEDNAVDRALVQRTAEILSRFPGPVFLLPGNHDPLLPGSVWEHPSWGQHSNLTVIREARAYPVPGGHLLAAPLTAIHSRKDPTAWLDGFPKPEGLVIAASHGTVDVIDDNTEHHPIRLRNIPGIAYLALGHWHSGAHYENFRAAYCGTHESTRFGERNSGNVYRVTIGPSAAPGIEAIRTGKLQWFSLEEFIRLDGDLEALYLRLTALPEKALVKLELTGLLSAADTEFLHQIRGLRQRFLYLSVNEDALLPAATDEAWIAALPEGPPRIAAVRLRDRAAQGDQIAASALRQLQAYARQAGA